MNKLTILFLFTILTLTGCNNAKQGYGDLNSKAKSYVLRDYDAYLEEDKISYNRSEPIGFQEVTFDTWANEASTFKNNNGEFIESQVNKYDEKGKLIYRKSYFRLYGEEGTTAYQLIDQKKDTCFYFYYLNDLKKTEYIHKLVIKGKSKSHYVNNTLVSVEKKNKHNQIIEQIAYKSDGTPSRQCTYKYSGKLLIQENCGKDKTCNLPEHTYKYLKYDDRENWTFRATYKQGELENVTEREIQY